MVLYGLWMAFPERTGLAFDFAAEVERACGHPIGRGEKVEAMKLDNQNSVEDKRKWKLVRTDSLTDIKGEIITADEATGECSIIDSVGETKTLNFGPHGIRIVGRRR
jgi:hypothetical protein